MLALARNPDQLARLRKNPALMPKAIQQGCVPSSPFHVSLALLAVRKPVGFGLRLEPGTLMFVILAAANP